MDKRITPSGFSVPSKVPDQPVGDGETRQGAINRAIAVWDSYFELHGCPPDFAVGLEGGVGDDAQASMHPSTRGLPGNVVQCFAWMAVLKKKSKDGECKWA